MLGLHEEGIQQAKEALEIYERLGDTAGQAQCLNRLARYCIWTNNSTPQKKPHLAQSNFSRRKAKNTIALNAHRILGNIYRSKGEREKAIHHFEAALGIASPFNLARSAVLDSFLPGAAVFR
jgi:tetratricopeptide (TPR) repeat protein